MNTDNLIPGEYYWVKRTDKCHEWNMSRVHVTSTGKMFEVAGWMHLFYPDDIHAIYCDTNGNPIPIEPPTSAKTNFARLLLSMAEAVSETKEDAEAYLREQGYDVEKVVSEGLERIKRLQAEMKNTEAAASYFKTDKIQ